MEGLLSYIRERGGIVNKNIVDNKVPTDEQLNKFAAETVDNLKKLMKDAPDQVKSKIMLPWAPQWDFQRNRPGGSEEHKLTPEKMLDTLKRVKDALAAPVAKAGGPPGGARKGGGKGKERAEGGEQKEEEEKRIPIYTGPTSVDTIAIESNCIGRIVGPKGTTMKMIQDNSDCKVDINDDLVTVTGPEDGIPIAIQAIKELCEKGFCGLSYGADFQEQAMNIHPIYFSELIGKEGKVIRAIKDVLKVELSIPKTPPNAKIREMTKKLKVGFAGKKPDVEKAKEVVSDILMYGHHEITHPGVAHSSCTVEPHQTRFIIGKGGSEMKHIQNSYRVKVSIPNEHSVNQDLLVVGEPKNVEHAIKYIENAIIAAEERAASGGRSRDGGGGGGEDYWGEEEQAEPWMSQYMYKRK